MTSKSADHLNSFLQLSLCLGLSIVFGCDRADRAEPTRLAQEMDQKIIEPAPSQTSAEAMTATVAPNRIAPNRIVRLKIDVAGFESNEGNCRIAVYLNQPHFNDPEYAIAKESVGILDLKANWQVDVEVRESSSMDTKSANRLAVSAFHDSNTNTRLDKNTFGIPTERYGFSKNPKRGFGPPKFVETALELDLQDSSNDSSEVVEVSIQIK